MPSSVSNSIHFDYLIVIILSILCVCTKLSSSHKKTNTTTTKPVNKPCVRPDIWPHPPQLITKHMHSLLGVGWASGWLGMAATPRFRCCVSRAACLRNSMASHQQEVVVVVLWGSGRGHGACPNCQSPTRWGIANCPIRPRRWPRTFAAGRTWAVVPRNCPRICTRFSIRTPAVDNISSSRCRHICSTNITTHNNTSR